MVSREARVPTKMSRAGGRGRGPAESTARGITLVELLVVMAIISLMISISYPTLTAGLDGIRLQTSLDRAGAFFHAARQEADHRQQPVQFTVDPERNRLTAVTIDSGWQDELGLPDAIHIAYPKVEQNLVLFPGSPAPALRLQLEARDGSRGGFQISVFTGTPEKWQGPREAEP